MRRSIAATVVALMMGATACSDDGVGEAVTPSAGSPSSSGVTTGASSSGAPSAGATPTPRVAGTVARGIDVPWGLAVLSDGRALVAERDSGRVLLIADVTASTATPTPVGVVPNVAAAGEGGLLGLAVAPGDDGTVFAYLTTDAGDNRVVALPFDGKTLGAPRTLLKGIPAAGNHNGGRMVVGPDGDLYIGTGDGGERSNSQNRSSLGGKILRITTTGAVPADNPFDSPVWSYGHRNVQGLAFDSAGRLWAAEFGQNTYDELNLITKGANYGWPTVEGAADDDRFVDPQVTWSTDEASPSGVAIVDDVAYVAGLRGERLWEVPLAGGRAGTPVARFTGQYGRLRTVVPAPGGGLLLTTSNRDGRGEPGSDDDRILRLSLT